MATNACVRFFPSTILGHQLFACHTSQQGWNCFINIAYAILFSSHFWMAPCDGGRTSPFSFQNCWLTEVSAPSLCSGLTHAATDTVLRMQLMFPNYCAGNWSLHPGRITCSVGAGRVLFLFLFFISIKSLKLFIWLLLLFICACFWSERF